ncbi:MAG TPA: cation diffusion facilitator family transporter, partial [Methylotenera sp.]|nr:cation diffusion facilitator family transporter [Methylotenera sp.]
RYKQPQHVQGLEVMVIAVFGLVVNLIVAKLLHHQPHHHEDTLNKRAAFLHVMGDLLGSVAAIVAGLVIYLTGWMQIDPILSLLISILLLVFTFNLIRDIWQTLQLKQDHIHHSETQQDHTH